MRIGVPKEIKNRESRVALTPAGAEALIRAGHDVSVERAAGRAAGYADTDYAELGARIGTAQQAWSGELVVKVKEPLEAEYRYLRGQIVFTYFHLAGVTPQLTEALLASGTTALAYETVEDSSGRLPLLAPMSAVAGNMAVAMGNYYLAECNGGRGMLLGRVLGQGFGKVLVMGDGVVGRHAARSAAALGAEVALAGRHQDRVPELRREIPGDWRFVRSEPQALADEAAGSDLVVGAVLLRGARAPYVLTHKGVAGMPEGSVIVDVSIDQGGCVETARPTTHSAPVYVASGVTHYCVTNMPGAYPRTSTLALTAATLPYVRRLADEGLSALRTDSGFAKGLNVHAGYITCRAVADARSGPYRDLAVLL